MAVPVADRSSNKDEQIVHAAEVIGRSKQRANLFREIYRGKRRVKTVSALMQATGLPRQRVLDAGRYLSDNDLVHQTKCDNQTAYEKIDFFRRYRDKVLRLATDPKKRKQVPTKRNPARKTRLERITVEVRVRPSRLKAKRITVDDVQSFKKVDEVNSPKESTPISEQKFKRGIASILNEPGAFKDWGGELRDLSSTRLYLAGKRRAAAFAFKGPGTKARLTLAKMGKNGDQIQRLFKCPAEVFIVQYQGEIDDMIYAEMETFAKLRSYLFDEVLYWGVIDDVDSRRIIEAYPDRF